MQRDQERESMGIDNQPTRREGGETETGVFAEDAQDPEGGEKNVDSFFLSGQHRGGTGKGERRGKGYSQTQTMAVGDSTEQAQDRPWRREEMGG